MLKEQLNQIEQYFNKLEFVNNKVSKASVGWHLDHSLKVINKVCETIKESNPKEYKSKFNTTKSIVFTLGFFPRGKAKSPKRVLPPEIILLEDLQNQLAQVKINIESIKELEKNKFFTHPIFKQLNKKETFKFLKLHTNHHLKIVKDILN